MPQTTHFCLRSRIPAPGARSLVAAMMPPTRDRTSRLHSTSGNALHAFPLPKSRLHPIAPARCHRRVFARGHGPVRVPGNASVFRGETSGTVPSFDPRWRKLGFRSSPQKNLAPDPPRRVAQFLAAAKKDKSVANKSGTAPKARAAHVLTMSGNQRLGTQSTSAWKQTSCPALSRATLPAFRDFYLDNRKFTSPNYPSIRSGIRFHRPYPSLPAVAGDPRFISRFPSAASPTHLSTMARRYDCRDRGSCLSLESRWRDRAERV